MNYGFVIDNRKCIGCHACTVACKAEHDVPLGVNRTWVKYIEKGTFPDTQRFFSVLRCNHCDNAPCVTICPTTALYRRDDGIVDFDPDRCIGCKACMQGCPYDAIYIDPDAGTAAKCNYCAHRVEVNLAPPCAVVCPEEAIVAGDLDDPASKIATLVRTRPVQVRRPEKGTAPRVYYVEGDAASLNPTAAAEEGTGIWSQTREPGPAPRRPAAGSTSSGEGLLAPEIWDRVRAVMGEKADRIRRTYDTGQTHRDSWGARVSAYLWTKSVAAGCLMAAPFLPAAPAGESLRPAAVGLALLFLTLTGILLVSDLKRPARFLWVLIRPQWRSWLTRGAYLLALFGALAAALSGVLWFDRPRWWRVLAWPAAVSGALAAIYTAFLFWQSKGRDLWQSPLLPVHLLVQAAVAGCAALLLAAATGLGVAPAGFERWLWGLLVLNGALIGLELFAVHPTRDAAAAARWMRTGPRVHTLAWGVVAGGHLLPLALIPVTGPGAAAAAALLALAGLALFDHLYIRAGQSVPLT